MNDNGWKVDEHGQRYRETAPGHREFEMMIRIDGVEIPQSELSAYHARKKEQDEKRRAAALEEFKNRPPTKYCPFNSSMNNQCKRDGCNLFLNGKCAVAAVADAFGVELEEKKTGKCPFSIYSRCDSCALNNGGCAFLRLAKVNK